jgi:hypothetical protein
MALRCSATFEHGIAPPNHAMGKNLAAAIAG